MVKAGLIAAAVMLILGSVGAIILPIVCVPCLALFVGVGAGYLSGQFDKPAANNLAARGGAIAGAIGGVGAIIAHAVGASYVAFVQGPAASAAILGQDPSVIDPTTFYISAYGTGCCLGLFVLALLAGLGALGGVLWYRQANNKPAAPVAM